MTTLVGAQQLEDNPSKSHRFSLAVCAIIVSLTEKFKFLCFLFVGATVRVKPNVRMKPLDVILQPSSAVKLACSVFLPVENTAHAVMSHDLCKSGVKPLYPAKLVVVAPLKRLQH